MQLLVIRLDHAILVTLVICLDHVIRVPFVVCFDHDIWLLLCCVSVFQVKDRCCTILAGISTAALSGKMVFRRYVPIGADIDGRISAMAGSNMRSCLECIVRIT